MDTKSKIREAEAYHSMGFLKEALDIYQEILSGISGVDPSGMEISGSLHDQINRSTGLFMVQILIHQI